MVSEAREHADERYEALRTSVPQGCTGLWQISGASGRVSDSPEFDRFYVAQQTLRLDMWILWRTLRQAFLRRPTRLADIPRWALRRPKLAVVEGA
jgi:lipopolysaccharide/colanic/teichoic acid biosynthesis glycosyltransferase